MATSEFRFDPSQILTPAFPSALNRLDPCAFGPSLTITRGQAMAQKVSDKKMYPLALGASDGTQTFAGFAQYSLTTDANSNIALNFGGTTGGSYYGLTSGYNAIYTGGIFDPRDLTTSATGTPVAEVDTFTPAGTITTGDIDLITLPNGDQVSFTVGATATATAVTTGLKAAWAANPVAAALATASGTTTFILTAATPGQPLNLTSSVNGVGTLTKAVTTAASAGAQGEVDTWTLGTPATGDIYTATITSGGGQTSTVTFTVGATQTAAAVVAGLTAAWNANGPALQVATPSGSTTFILTAANVGQSLNVALTTSGAGSVSKAVTTPATGRNIADILPGCPGARILAATGFWELP